MSHSDYLALLRTHAEALAIRWEVTGQRPGRRVVADVLGITADASRRRVMPALVGLTSPADLREWAGLRAPASAADRAADIIDDPDPLPPERIPVEDLIRERINKHVRLREHAAARRRGRVIPVSGGPIGLLALGDPHIDDDGCDVEALEADLLSVAETPGCYTLSIGDVTNGWGPRLARLYAEQGTSRAEALQLAEWLFERVDFAVGGNHDRMTDDGWALVCHMMRTAGVRAWDKHELRLTFDWGSAQIRVHARHDFGGHSQWNQVHGLKKAAMFDGWGDLLVAGHKHNASGLWWVDETGRPREVVRVAGYKVVDDYQEQLGFAPTVAGHSVLYVLDPDAGVDRIRMYRDVEAGCNEVARLRGAA